MSRGEGCWSGRGRRRADRRLVAAPAPFRPAAVSAGRDEASFDAWLKIAATAWSPSRCRSSKWGRASPRSCRRSWRWNWARTGGRSRSSPRRSAAPIPICRWRRAGRRCGSRSRRSCRRSRRLAGAPLGAGQRFTATADGTSLAAYRRPLPRRRRQRACDAGHGRGGPLGRRVGGMRGARAASSSTASSAELRRAGAEAASLHAARSAAAAVAGSGRKAERLWAISTWPHLLPPARPAVQGRWLLPLRRRRAPARHGVCRDPPRPDRPAPSWPGSTRMRRRESPGLVGVVKGKRWLAAVASDWWAAERALGRLKPRFRRQRARWTAARSTTRSKRRCSRRGPHASLTRGDGDECDRQADLAARATTSRPRSTARSKPPAPPRAIETARLELWIAQPGARAGAPGRGESARHIRPRCGALSDARRRQLRPAAGTRPRHRGRADRARNRPAGAADLVALAGSARGPSAHAGRRRCWQPRPARAGTSSRWRARLALPPTAQEFGQRLFGNADELGRDRGQRRHGRSDGGRRRGCRPMAIANVAVDHVPAEIGLPTGRMRGNAHGYTCFFNESFIDELAAKHQREPLSYRMEMLGNDRAAGRLPPARGAAGRMGRRARPERAGPRLPPDRRRPAAGSPWSPPPAGRRRREGGEAVRSRRHRPDRQSRHRAPADRRRAGVRHRPRARRQYGL